MSYKLCKERGNNANVYIENTDTHSSVMVGKLSMEMLHILEEESGLKFGSGEHGTTALRSEWSIDITEEVSRKIASTALSMHKPARTTTQKKKKDTKNIDALDVLLGLASY